MTEQTIQQDEERCRPLITFEVTKFDWHRYCTATGYAKTLLHLQIFYGPQRKRMQLVAAERIKHRAAPERHHYGEYPTVRVAHPIPHGRL